jgi:hypothetical protein
MAVVMQRYQTPMLTYTCYRITGFLRYYKFFFRQHYIVVGGTKYRHSPTKRQSKTVAWRSKLSKRNNISLKRCRTA